MKQFIEVTAAGEAILINLQNVTSIENASIAGLTKINFIGGSNVVIEESYPRVVEKVLG